MKSFAYLLLLTLMMTGSALADTRYEMRVDGLACPYCAYGIEKKLKQLQGVKDIEIDLNAGMVRITTPEDVTLTESQMRKLFHDAGFTFRGMETTKL